MNLNESITLKLPYNMEIVQLYVHSHFAPDYINEVALEQDSSFVRVTTSCSIISAKIKGMFKTVE